MQLILQPDRSQWEALTTRPFTQDTNLNSVICPIFEEVKNKGDIALKYFTQKYDKAELQNIRLSPKELATAGNAISSALKDAIQLAYRNILAFHQSQAESPKYIETTAGVRCWRESRPIERVGIYIPGGTAPLFSTLLMLGIPAQLAGCNRIAVCTPPSPDGSIHPAILYTAQLMGLQEIYKVGGIQAIAGLTFGTETMPKVYKIFGPGNRYVTAAKQYALNYGVAIDMPAGPSEVLVIATPESDPAFVAADLLSQAEHGTDSQVVLLCTQETVAQNILQEIDAQLSTLPRKDIAVQALAHSKAIVLPSVDECIEFSNVYAPEHLILSLGNAKKYIANIQNAGSVFLGKYSCESAGDYASGTNHTLPTNGYARNYSGVSLDSFTKKISFQEISAEGIRNIGPAIEQMAEAEQLVAHKNAVSVRLKSLNFPENKA